MKNRKILIGTTISLGIMVNTQAAVLAVGTVIGLDLGGGTNSIVSDNPAINDITASEIVAAGGLKDTLGIVVDNVAVTVLGT